MEQCNGDPIGVGRMHRARLRTVASGDGGCPQRVNQRKKLFSEADGDLVMVNRSLT